MKMFNRKLPMPEVERLLAEGKSMSQAARELGFSKQAVSKALKKRRESEGGLVPAKGPKGVSDFEGLRQLKKIMSPVFEEIKTLNSEIKKMQAEKIKSEDRKNLNFQRLKYVAEGRKQPAQPLGVPKRNSFS